MAVVVVVGAEVEMGRRWEAKRRSRGRMVVGARKKLNARMTAEMRNMIEVLDLGALGGIGRWSPIPRADNAQVEVE